MVKVLAILVTAALMAACGQPEETPAPTSVAIDTSGRAQASSDPLPSPTPTRTPRPTATPLPTATPSPTPDIEATITARVEAAIKAREELAEQAPTAPATVTPDPTPTPESRVRAVDPPAAELTANALQVKSISITNGTLRMSGIIEGQGHKPTSMQVWHAYDFEPYSDTCSTERPVAFVQPGNGTVTYTGYTSPYQWTFCRNGVSSEPEVDEVPWVYSQKWQYELRDRRRITDPYIYDFDAVVSLDHERIKALEYGSGVAAGWRVIVFSGSEIITSQWIDY